MDERVQENAQSLNEDQALAILRQKDVTAETLASLARSPDAIKIRKLVLALITHPRIPRHIAVPLLRRMFTFDLMQVALTPAVAADIKRAAEEQIVLRLESLSAGEKISLAKRGSGHVAASLLQETDSRVITTALDNSRLTEVLVVQELGKARASEGLFRSVSGHYKWSRRREVQIALLRSEKTPLETACELAKDLPEGLLRQIIPAERLDALLSRLAR
jgi:hypothetical protein